MLGMVGDYERHAPPAAGDICRGEHVDGGRRGSSVNPGPARGAHSLHLRNLYIYIHSADYYLSFFCLSQKTVTSNIKDNFII